MNLLKELPLNLRWYLLHTTTNEIIIVYYKSASEIPNEDSDTILESSYFQTVLSKYMFIDSDTIKKTRNDNVNTIDEFNNDIEKYCLSIENVSEIRLINAQYTHYVLFEDKVFDAMCKCANNLYFELGYSGIRLNSNSYDKLTKFEFVSGYLFPEKTVTIKCDEYRITDINVNVYNGSLTENETALNIVINKTFKANRMQIYSTIKTVLSSGEMSPTDFDSSKISIAYLKLYGEEINQSDKHLNRLKIFGIKKVNIGEIEIDEKNKYGNIISVNNVTTFTLNKITRQVTELDMGSFLSIGNVGIVNIHNINFTFTENSAFNSDTSLISFIDDSNNLSRKINIYNSDVHNESLIPFTLFNLNNVNIEKIYISTCIFGKKIKLLKTLDNSIIKKLYINDTTLECDNDFILPKVDKLNLTNVTFDSDSNIELNAPYIFITGGLFNFDTIFFKNSDGIDKISLEDVELHGNKLKISEEMPSNSILFDINSTLDIKNIDISGISTTLNETKIHSNNIKISTSNIVNCIKTFFFMDKKNVKFNCNSSICGTFMISDSEKNNTFTLNINDKYERLNINSIDIISNTDTPIIKTTTNVPVDINVYNSDNVYSYMSYTTDYDSTRNSKIEFFDNINNPVDHIVLTDSEKKCKITKTDNIFTVTKI